MAARNTDCLSAGNGRLLSVHERPEGEISTARTAPTAEPVSPELALIDPELRRRLSSSEEHWAIQQTTLRAPVRAAVGAEPGAVAYSASREAITGEAEVDSERPRIRRWAARTGAATLKVASVVALTTALVWAGIWATGDDVTVGTGATPTRAVRPPTTSTTPPTLGTTGLRTRPARPHQPPAPPVGGSSRVIAQVERTVLALLPGAVRAGRAPKSLVDPATGLLRNGTVIDCVLRGARRYGCSVVAGHTTATVTANREATGVVSIVARRRASG